MKIVDKKALQRFKQRVKEILEFDGVDPYESEELKAKRIRKLKSSFGDFVQYYFPHLAKCPSAQFHKEEAKKLRENSHYRGVVMWARGHAKTTHFSLFFPLWLKACDELKFMVLVGKNGDSAAGVLSDLQAELEFNRRYINDFGAQMSIGSWQEGRFATKDDCCFVALGRGQSPRGLLHKGNRPDYIVMDDVDDDEIVHNPKRMQKLHDWSLEALFMTMAAGRGRFIAVGNKIHNDSLIARLASNKSFDVTTVNAYNSIGEPVWPENYTVEEIEGIIETLGYRRAQKELFNNPIVEGAIFKRADIVFADAPPLHEFKSIINYTDPSFKNTRTADFKASITVGWANGRYYILDCFVRKCTVAILIEHLFDHYDRFNSKIRYYMEANFIQDLIFEEFTKEGRDRGYHLPIQKDVRKKPDKFQRIESISPLFERRHVLISRDLEGDDDTLTLIEQLLAFESGSKAHDDAPDALEGAIFILNRKHKTSSSHLIGGRYSNRESRAF